MPTLQFEGKTAVECHHHTVPHHTLEFDQKLSVLGKGEKPTLDGNLIIEGDNLLALKALLPTHAGRIKCIYIDPPYNIGNPPRYLASGSSFSTRRVRFSTATTFTRSPTTAAPIYCCGAGSNLSRQEVEQK